MKVLSLFSGVGGFDMGLENAGMETVFQCEWDKHCLTILDRHWPDVPKWDDVSTLTGKHILAGVPVIDVVAWVHHAKTSAWQVNGQGWKAADQICFMKV